MGLAIYMPEYERPDDLHRAEYREPGSGQCREHGDRRDRSGSEHYAGDEAYDPEEHPPAVAVDRPPGKAGKTGKKPHQALNDPGDADEQPYNGRREVDVPHEHHPEHDEQYTDDGEPTAVLLAAVEYPDQVNDPGHHEQDAEQYRDDGERARRIGGDDDP